MITRIAWRPIVRYKYRLAEPYSVETGIRPRTVVVEPRPPNRAYVTLSKTGRLTVASLYAWDGASGPMPDIRSVMRAALVHDALYQLLRTGRLPPGRRADADRLFHRLCREDGMNPVLGWIAWSALRWFGGPAAAVQTDVRRSP